MRFGWLKRAAPGIVTGAANDDPVAITTYLQAGAAHGFALLWLVFLLYPVMWLMHLASARIGRTTGRGLVAGMLAVAPSPLVALSVGLIVLANMLQIGANLTMMGDVGAALTGLPAPVFALAFGGGVLAAQLTLPYERFVSALQWSCLALASYVVAVMFVDLPLGDAARGLVPSVSLSADWLAMTLAIIGSALSPYVLIWQASQEADEQRLSPQRERLAMAPEQAPAALGRIRFSTGLGMAIGTLVSAAILVTAAATLHGERTAPIASASEAAAALAPLAGAATLPIFAIGIVGTGLLAIPVLAGSAAYGLGELLRRRVGLWRDLDQGRLFYGTIAATLAGGTAVALAGIEPGRIIAWSALLNALVIVPVLALTVLAASRRDEMGRYPLHPALTALLLAVVLAIAGLAIALALSQAPWARSG